MSTKSTLSTLSRPPDSAGKTRRGGPLRPLAMLKPYILRHKPMLMLAGAALVVSALAMLAIPMAARRMIDVGFGANDGVFIDRYFAMLIAIGLVLAIASAVRLYCVNWIGERVVADVQADVFRHLTALPPAFFERTQSGDIVSRLSADTAQIKTAAGSGFSQALRNTIMLVGALGLMIVTSPQLSLLVLGAIPIVIVPIAVYGRVVRRLSRDAQDELARASAYAAENLAAIRTLQAGTNEPAVIRRYTAVTERVFSAARARLRARAGLTALVIFLVVAGVVGILWVGATRVVQGGMTGGRLGQFILYAVFAAGALAELSEVWSEVQQAAGAAERLAELLAIRPAIRSPAVPKPLPHPPRGEIEFRGVHFAYPSRPHVAALHGVSFRIAPGETAAIIGPSGAGKSTVFNLLLRFYDADAGTVRVGGVATAEADLVDLRRHIALVPQEAALFADTVAENIRYGAPAAGDDDVRRVAEAAQADAFIRALPLGYDTPLGERGVTLSGGQRQRIALARALLRDAPILLLDEATSALDAESESAIQKALERVMVGRTTLVIAHRPETIRKVRRILVLNGGRLVRDEQRAAGKSFQIDNSD